MIAGPETEIIDQVRPWRIRALKHVMKTRCARERGQLAIRYYQADQKAMRKREWCLPWPAMKKRLPKIISDQEARERLIKPRSSGKNVFYIRKAWMPTLEEFREIHPFDPYDDLSKPYRNKDRDPSK